MRANLCCYVCQNMRNMTFCPATNEQHQPIHPLTHVETYAASRTHLNQLPEPTNQHRYECPDTRNATDTPQTTTPPVDLHHHACQDIHNTTDTPQSAAIARHHYNLRMLRHTQPPATTQKTAAPTPASTPAPAPPPHQTKRHAIDHFDRDIRRRITARVWRAAAPLRPRSSSTQAD
ncbi:hypothetical protein BBOU_1747 [Bifidobacterium boum]|uniref:Uncharacterized protein n=1 Tax=Bifidobacterium boum TaxID=78343 RepID=A0A086ZFH9_9BIFI|nr:hypothetical protein BBOU_1747 [Bifidobacterium boum]